MSLFSVRGNLARGLGLVFLLGGVACGLLESLYIDYGPKEETAADGTKPQGEEARTGAEEGNRASKDCQNALAVFSSNLMPALTNTCATVGCHLTNLIAGKTLTKDDATKNREILLAFDSSTNGAKLIDKVSNKISHGGGNLSATLPAAKITQWKAAEAACPNQSKK